jgi:hypothetical protein
MAEAGAKAVMPDKPCRVCGGLERYVNSFNCVACTLSQGARWAKENRERKAMREVRLDGCKVREWMLPLSRAQMDQVMRKARYENVNGVYEGEVYHEYHT